MISDLLCAADPVLFARRRLDLSPDPIQARFLASRHLYETPSFDRHKVLKWAAGSWRLGLLTTLQSGPPFTIVTAANTTNAFSAGALRPNLLRNPTLSSDQRTLGRWFDTPAFVTPAKSTRTSLHERRRTSRAGAVLVLVFLTSASRMTRISGNAWERRIPKAFSRGDLI